MGSECKVFPPTGEEYCEPSCDIDNGGCDDDKICKIGLPSCVYPREQPCVGEVACLTEGSVHMQIHVYKLIKCRIQILC